MAAGSAGRVPATVDVADLPVDPVSRELRAATWGRGARSVSRGRERRVEGRDSLGKKLPSPPFSATRGTRRVRTLRGGSQ